MFEQLSQDILAILDAPITDPYVKLGIISEMIKRTIHRKIVEESKITNVEED